MVKRIRRKEREKVQLKPDNELISYVGSHKRPAFLTIIPTLGWVSIEFHMAALRLAMPANARSSAIQAMHTPVDFPHPKAIRGELEGKSIKGEEIGKARNWAARLALSMNPLPEFFFFFGDDMIPDAMALVALYDEAVKGRWDVLSALYHIKMPYSEPVPILWREEMSGYMMAGRDYQIGETVVSDICGMDFTLIRPEILKRMTEPYFLTGPQQDANGIVENFTEDAFFCAKAKRQAHAKMGVCTAVRVGHLDTFTGEVY